MSRPTPAQLFLRAEEEHPDDGYARRLRFEELMQAAGYERPGHLERQEVNATGHRR